MTDVSTQSQQPPHLAHNPHSTVFDTTYQPNTGYTADSPLTHDTLAELKRAFTRNVTKYCDMSAELTSESTDLIISALDKYRNNYELAAKQIKELMDKKFSPNWHCVVGEGFGFDCTHQTGHCIHVYYQGSVSILLFKC